MSNAIVITQLLLEVTRQAQSYAATMHKAHSEGRDVSDEEVDAALADYDAVSAVHREAIARAKAEGR